MKSERFVVHGHGSERKRVTLGVRGSKIPLAKEENAKHGMQSGLCLERKKKNVTPA